MRTTPPSHPPATPPGPSADASTTALHTAARTLVALASELRWAVPKDPAAVLQALAAAVARFEQDAAACGCDPPTVVAASYLLCVWVDEGVAQTPWGAAGAGAGLLRRFHGDDAADGGEKVFRLLSKLAQQPHRHAGLLQLFHACLSLGLQGRWRDRADGARQLELLRARLHALLLQIQPGSVVPARDAGSAGAAASSPPLLSPDWRRADLVQVRWPRRWLWGSVLAMAVLAFGVYAGLRLHLAQQADAVFASMQGLEQRSRAGAMAGAEPARAEPAPAAPRLAVQLAADVQQGRLRVRDEAHRSTVSLPADSLFEAGSTRLLPQALPLLARVAAAIRTSSASSTSSTAAAASPLAPGAPVVPSATATHRLLVASYSDGVDARSVRLPSAWHQTLEWATAVAQALQRELPATPVAIESRGDSELPQPPSQSPSQPPSTTPLPRRRIEIVLFP